MLDAKLNATLDALIAKEGGYCNDPDDLGGETCWGVTVAEARLDGYTGPMTDLPQSRARDIYRRKYWFGPRFSDVSALSESVAEELFDTGVNMGIGKAGEFLQIALNAFNLRGTKYPDIAEDGDIGNKTLAALKAYLDWRGKEGETVLLRALNCQQGMRYLDISRGRQENETFTYGWFKERVA